MEELIKQSGSIENASNTSNSGTELVQISEALLADVRADLSKESTICVPIAQLSTLGAGVSSLAPALRTVAQTSTVNTTGLYRLANEAVGDTLKVAKNGNYWGAFKTAEGKSKFVQLKAADPLTVTQETVAAVNPATILMAGALFSIERQLGKIQEMQKSILSFLEIEKASEIEADVETLSAIISNYKLNWDNEHYVASNHKLVLDIQRTSRKNMLSYQKQVNDIVNGKKLVVAQAQVNSALQDLVKKFKYYRLSLYTFSMASMIEVMLGGNFNEEYISGVKSEIESMSSAYREIFDMCSAYLEKLSGASIEKNVLKGLGTASNAVGKLIGSIPLVKEGPIDEFLIDSGNNIKKNAQDMAAQSIGAFAEMSNPQTYVFAERLDDMISIYNHTEQICFDDKNIYLIAA